MGVFQRPLGCQEPKQQMCFLKQLCQPSHRLCLLTPLLLSCRFHLLSSSLYGRNCLAEQHCQCGMGSFIKPKVKKCSSHTPRTNGVVNVAAAPSMSGIALSASFSKFCVSSVAASNVSTVAAITLPALPETQKNRHRSHQNRRCWCGHFFS